MPDWTGGKGRRRTKSTWGGKFRLVGCRYPLRYPLKLFSIQSKHLAFKFLLFHLIDVKKHILKNAIKCNNHWKRAESKQKQLTNEIHKDKYSFYFYKEVSLKATHNNRIRWWLNFSFKNYCFENFKWSWEGLENRD